MEGRWWFKSLGQEFGPLCFADLIKAMRRGTLLASDLVRDERGEWRRADSVEGLLLRPPHAEWLVEVMGQTLGPLLLADVVAMIREQKLASSDRVRRVGPGEWQSIAGYLEQLESERRSITGERGAPATAAVDDLESLILAVLGAPIESRSEPGLVEFGLLEEKATDSAPATTGEPPCAPSRDTKTFNVRWSPRNLFRRSLSASAASQEPAALVATELESARGSTKTILPPVERFLEVHGSEEAHENRGVPRRFPWLEFLLLLGGISLVLELSPSATSTILGVIDIRRWSWSSWAAAEVVVIFILGGLAIWRRRLT
ncbi:MAG TPA: hypothetical protein VGG64_19850 [Pirellulales bacterium]|jgi:hypothetical protein